MAKRSGGKIGSKVVMPVEHAFNTTEEILHRDILTRQSTPTDSHPTFTQIGPEDSGGNLAQPSMRDVSGHFKFSKGIR